MRFRELRTGMARMVTIMVVAGLLAACGGQASRSLRHGDARAHATPAARPTPGAGRLVWKAGQTFTGEVAFDEQDQGAVIDELRFTAGERFRVLRVTGGGVATIRVAVTGWRWQRNTSQFLTGSLPAPQTFAVDAGGRIISGLDWPLPSQLPLPGLDLFAAPPMSSSGWTRTDSAGVDLAYQATGSASPGATTLAWSLVRPQFTRSGEALTVRGTAQVTVTSSYARRGATLRLRSTRERAGFRRSIESSAGTTDETGTVTEITTFSSP